MVLVKTPYGEFREPPYTDEENWEFEQRLRRGGDITINAVETDKYDPSLPLALRMARLFGVGAPELFIDQWEPEA